MRIEVPRETEAVLDEIREKERSIQGKGHSSTIRFLAQFYQDHETLEKAVEKQLAKIPEIVEEAINDTIRRVITNLFRIEKT